MGQVVSSIRAQHPVYTVTPLVCTVAASCAAYKARRWDPQDPSTLISAVHLASLAFTVGSQIWHDFIASPAMFRFLPRQTFGQIQKELFPRLFMLNTVMSSVTLSTFLMRHPIWEIEDEETVELGSLVIGMLGSVLNGLVLTPWATTLQDEMHKIEKKNDLKDIEAKKANPEYVQASRKFMKVHGLSFGVNVVGLLGSTVYLYLLASAVKDF